MQETIGIILNYALELIVAVVVILVTRVVIPWLKEKRLYGFIEKAVRAAEKLKESDQLKGQTKLEYVEKLLADNGYAMTDTVRLLIEAAVKTLDMDGGAIASEAETNTVGF